MAMAAWQLWPEPGGKHSYTRDNGREQGLGESGAPLQASGALEVAAVNVAEPAVAAQVVVGH